MTEPMPAAAPERAALWEDFLEIFVKPRAVFERRKAAGFGLALLVLTVLFAVLFLGLKGAFEPIMEAENARTIARIMAKNPQITPEMMAERSAGSSKFTPLIVTVLVPVTVLLLGLVTWVAGKLFGSVASLGAAMMIATYSYFPRLLELVVSGIQALLLPPEQLISRSSTSLGLARPLDPDTTSAMTMALLLRVDVFTLWITFLIAVGLHVVGKVPMGKATGAAVIVWFLGALPGVLGALAQG